MTDKELALATHVFDKLSDTGIVDSLQDPWDQFSEGDNYGSIPFDVMKIIVMTIRACKNNSHMLED